MDHPVPPSFGEASLSGLTPRFLHGYTEIVGRPWAIVDAPPGPPPAEFPDRVVTATEVVHTTK